MNFIRLLLQRSSEENMRIGVQSYRNKRYQYELLEMKIANADRLATWKRPVPAYRTSRPNRLLLITHDFRVTSLHQATKAPEERHLFSRAHTNQNKFSL